MRSNSQLRQAHPHRPCAVPTRACSGRVVLWSLLLAVCGGAVGCQAANEEAGESSYGHVIPAHKPESFPAAVTWLEKQKQTTEPLEEQAYRELKDVVQWLPELAAETDLKKTEWDQIHAITQQWSSGLAATSVEQWAEQISEQQWQQLQLLAEQAVEMDRYLKYQPTEPGLDQASDADLEVKVDVDADATAPETDAETDAVNSPSRETTPANSSREQNKDVE